MNLQMPMPKSRSMLCVAAVFTITALGTLRPTHAEPPNNPKAPPQACMTLPAGSTAAATETSDGAALVFTATGDPASIRAYAQRTAQMYNHMVSMQSGMPMGGSGGMGGAGMQGRGMHGGKMGMQRGAPIQLVPSHAIAENTATGARIVLVPDDASRRTALREQARRQATMIQQGKCPFRQPAAG